MKFPAHIRKDEQNGQTVDTVQTVETHCRAVARYAEAVLAPVGLGKAAYLAGLLHDFGKFTQKFSDYLWAAYRGQEVQRGSVNHTFAGVQFLFKNYYGTDMCRDITCELLAYAVGAHHGLFDLMKDRKEDGFPHRIQDTTICYDEAKQNFLEYCANQEELDGYFQDAFAEVSVYLKRILALCEENAETAQEQLMFYSGLLSRLLLSAVIEGDRRDTAEFMNGVQEPDCMKASETLWAECLSFLEERLDSFPQEKPIQRARRTISDLCKEKANQKGSLYRLNVPTGGGKTFASLRYALAHAKEQKKQRIFFVIPLLSIIDQNSKEIRRMLPREDIVLEHHSNVVDSRESGDELDPRELLTENWSAPLIITTLVQFLNTLFSGKTSSIRRFQALGGSVIIFDEVQTVPSSMLTLFNLAINFLTEFCGATVVLCSATQPCLEKVHYPLAREPKDMVPYDAALWAPFRRTRLENAGKCKLENLPMFILEQMDRHRSILVVCNKKDEAGMLYQELEMQIPHIFHLSASMCMQHRRETLDQLKEVLQPDSGITEGILCISTQVIEAGVDISFDCVIRLLAGMDSAVQSAGRCNRNGEVDGESPVYLLQCADENLTKLKDIQRAKDASIALLKEFENHAERYQNDLASDEAIAFYYQYLYRRMAQNEQDFPVKTDGGKGEDTIFNMLSLNTKQTAGVKSDGLQYFLHQSFQTAGSRFKVFDDNTTDVLVPYDKKSEEWIADLCSERAKYDAVFVKESLKRVKPYTVSLYSWQFDKMKKAGALYPAVGENAWILKKEYYSMKTGLSTEEVTGRELEATVCNFLI